MEDMGMKLYGLTLICLLWCLLCLLASPMSAQTQIGGGICSSASLNGTYSLTLTGRDVGSSVHFTNVSHGVGTATFDGESKVTFSLTTNTNQTFGLAQTLTGTYSLQANCLGAVTITSGDSATFTLEAFNNPDLTLSRNFLIAGQDGVYSFTGSGSLLPVSCAASLLSGAYSFSASAFALTSGSVSGVANISGLLTFDGSSAITASWSIAGSTAITDTASGQYTVAPGCTGKATLTDQGGSAWTLLFTITATNGSNFVLTGASSTLLFSGAGRAQADPTACSNATLTGSYSLVLTGRNVNNSTALSSVYQSVGSATFDELGNVTFLLRANTNLLQGVGQTLTGTYTLSANCTGTLDITVGDSASYRLTVWNQGKNLSITGQNANYLLTGTGGPQPPSCVTSLLSGTYAISGNGESLSSTSISGVNSISGLLEFDGRGGISGNWSISTNQAANAATISGAYSINAACQATATVTDSAGAQWALNFTMTSVDGAGFTVDGADGPALFSAAGHSTFTNPGLAVANAASGVSAGTPAGSIFALYGLNLAPSLAPATKVPLPPSLLSTSVTVNGETAPLFYVSQTQINAQMPWDIQSGVANVVVNTAGGMSNTVAVTVPATAVPGIFVQFPANQAVAVEYPEQTLNTAIAPAHVGDVIVAYFTGGGPVFPSGPLVTGGYSPLGQSPVVSFGETTVTVAGVQATVNYIGLTGMLVGIYQANFVVPNVAVGNRNVVITINGKASAATILTIAK
jgi:uncharacterized protein (TIGR03437 family)